MAPIRRHADLKNEFYQRVCTQTRQLTRKGGSETVAKLRETIASQRGEIRDLRHQFTQLTLAAAVPTQAHAETQAAPDNVVPLRADNW